MDFEGSFEKHDKHERLFRLLDSVKKRRPLWITISIVLVLGDYFTGFGIQFPFLYFIPVTLAAWGGSRTPAYALAIVLPATRILFTYLWNVPFILPEIIINFIIRASILAGLVFILFVVQNLRVIRGLIHTCSYCRRVRAPEGEWVTIEKFIVNNSEAMLSHGICPECLGKLKKEITLPQ